MKRQGFYRPDIDGLRAVAVVPVVLFHVGFPIVTGGFVGVDIFFVISGYLISSIIFKEISQDRFSYVDFYDRRIRRIFPALFVVLFAVITAAFFLLFPVEYLKLGSSVIFSALSLANVYFYVTINYFEGDNNPLLHLWSLAVEEQFYLVFPLILSLGWKRFGAKVTYLLAVIALVSLISAEVFVRSDSQASFYLPQFRVWELLIGSILATSNVDAPASVWWRNLLAVAGFALVVGSILLLDRASRFPGLSAVPACAGTALLIMSASKDRSNFISQLLSLSPIRFVGLISYSLYLWHWPVIVLTRQGGAFLPFTVGMNWRGRLVLVGMSMVAAVVSWYFIERPFRSSNKFQKTRVIKIGLAASFAFCLAGSLIVYFHGFPQRFGHEVQKLASFTDYDPALPFRSGTCFIDSKYTSSSFDYSKCLPATGPGRRILVLGDSHAAHLLPGIRSTFPGDTIGQVTVSGCRPLDRQPISVPQRCSELMHFGLTDGLSRFRPNLVVVAGNWQARDLPALESTLSSLRAKGAQVLLFGPVPAYDSALPKLLAVAQFRNRPAEVATHLIPGLFELDQQMRRIAKSARVGYVSPLRTLCPREGEGCVVFARDGTPMQFDESHLTAIGSATLFDKLTITMSSGTR